MCCMQPVQWDHIICAIQARLVLTLTKIPELSDKRQYGADVAQVFSLQTLDYITRSCNYSAHQFTFNNIDLLIYYIGW